MHIGELKLENYFFDGQSEKKDNKKLILVIYDIVDNKRRYKFVKFVEKFGFRVQKSAFEMIISESVYSRLVAGIPRIIESEDNVRVYRLPVSGEVAAWGSELTEKDEVIII